MLMQLSVDYMLVCYRCPNQPITCWMVLSGEGQKNSPANYFVGKAKKGDVLDIFC